MEPETLFLQGPDEALDDPMALGLADERRRVRAAQPGALVANASAAYCGPQSLRSAR